MSDFKPKEVLAEARELERAGKRSQAAAKFAQVAIYLRRKGRCDEAKSLLLSAIRLSPESPRLHLQLALCEEKAGDVGMARSRMETFSRLVLEKPERATVYRDYLEAELKSHASLRQVFYDASLALDRTDARPFLQRAKALMEQGEKEDALSALIDALKTKTHDLETNELLRELLKWRGEKGALDHLARFEAGKLERDDFIALIHPRGAARSPEKGAAAEPGRSTVRARQKRAREEEPTLSDLIQHLEKELGLDIEESKDTVRPLLNEFRRRSAKILAGDSKGRIDMALAYFEMGLVDEAAEELGLIPEGDPLYAEARCLLGEFLFQSNSLLGALDVYHRCLREEKLSESVQAECRYKLVQIYLRLGDGRRALEVARDLEKLMPEYRDLRNLKKEAMAAASGEDEPEVEASRSDGKR